MDEIYFWARMVNFVWAFALFLVMLWGFVLDRIVSRHCTHTHIPFEMHVWMTTSFVAVLVVIWSTSEVLLTDIPGGPRVFSPVFVLIPCSIGIKHALFRVKMHRISIETGACK